MQLVRPSIAANPRLFGRGPVRSDEVTAEAAPRWSDGLKLFAATFAAGFLFVSIVIG